MLSKIFREELLSPSDKYKHKIFTEGRPVCLLHCIENILNHLCGIRSAVNGWTKSTGLSTIYSLMSPLQQRNYQLEKNMPIPILVLNSKSLLYFVTK